MNRRRNKVFETKVDEIKNEMTQLCNEHSLSILLCKSFLFGQKTEMEKSVRLYRWVTKSEVAYMQAIIDAHEGIARVRTEKHHGNESLIFFLTTPTREKDLLRLFEQFQEEGLSIRTI